MNPITVIVKRIGQVDISLTVQKDTKVSDVLRMAEISAQGWTFRFDGYNVDLNTPLTRNGSLLLTKAIRGN